MTVRTRPDEERVWLQFAIAGVQGMSSIDNLSDDDALAVDAAALADKMIEKWRERYPELAPATTDLEDA